MGGGCPAQLNRCTGCADGPVHPARSTGVYQVGQWAEIYRPKRCATGSPPLALRQPASNQARLGRMDAAKALMPGSAPLGRLLRNRLPGNGRAAQWRTVLRLKSGSNPDRTLAHPLQHRQAAQRNGLSPACTRKHRHVGPTADDALTITPDHPMGARQQRCRMARHRSRQAAAERLHRDFQRQPVR